MGQCVAVLERRSSLADKFLNTAAGINYSDFTNAILGTV